MLRVRQLLAAGALEGRRLGRQWLVCAAALLDGRQAEWLTSGERSRLLARLSVAEGVAVFQRWLRLRHESVTRYRAADADVAGLLQEQGVVRTGGWRPG